MLLRCCSNASTLPLPNRVQTLKSRLGAWHATRPGAKCQLLPLRSCTLPGDTNQGSIMQASNCTGVSSAMPLSTIPTCLAMPEHAPRPYLSRHCQSRCRAHASLLVRLCLSMRLDRICPGTARAGAGFMLPSLSGKYGISIPHP
jgi:hypothetical protein